jgi:hypothetical protein
VIFLPPTVLFDQPEAGLTIAKVLPIEITGIFTSFCAPVGNL